ncbi:MAG: hypothetical protein QMD14_01660 [Candidatus Aenigmarchaeota archaeon]|nr:hypothetical protein [Candidatus Aenigmarchaeota archaeon]
MCYPIVLTANKTLMSNYGENEFLGFAATSPGIVPELFYEKILCSPGAWQLEDEGITSR